MDVRRISAGTLSPTGEKAESPRSEMSTKVRLLKGVYIIIFIVFKHVPCSNPHIYNFLNK